MKKLKWNKSFVAELPLIKQGLDFIKTHSFPGFFGVPIYDIMVFLINEFKNQRITFRANSIAFSFFVSLFPAIIVIINLLAYIPVEGVISTMDASLAEVLPATAHDFLFSTINDIVNKPRAGLLSVSFLLAIFIASNGMMAMMHSFDKSHEISFRRPSGLEKRLRAIILTALLALLVILSIVLIIAGQSILAYLSEKLTGNTAEIYKFLSVLRWVLILILFYTAISLIYHYGPALTTKLNFFSAGTTLATILSILSSLVFSLYVNNFGMYNTIYGSIGAIIVLLLWIQINSFILLVGFELNASIAVNRDLKKLREEEDAID